MKISPDIFYHHLVSLEIEKRGRRVNFLQNFTYEHPLLKSYKNSIRILQKRPSTLLSTSYLNYKATRYMEVFSSYRYVYQKYDEENVISNKEFFSSHLLFFNAVSLGLKSTFYLGKILSDNTMKFVYDLEQKGGIFSWRLDFHLSPKWKAFFLVEFLGLIGGDLEKQLENRKHFLRDMRTNDRLQGGLRYVF